MTLLNCLAQEEKFSSKGGCVGGDGDNEVGVGSALARSIPFKTRIPVPGGMGSAVAVFLEVENFSMQFCSCENLVCLLVMGKPLTDLEDVVSFG